MSKTTITDDHLRAAIARDYAGHGGGQRLANKLCCSNSTASLIRRGGGTLEKVAALYGYIAGDEPGTWVKSNKQTNPRFIGYIRWTPDLLAEIEFELSHGQSTHSIAKMIGITRKHLLEIMRLHGVKKPAWPLKFLGVNNVPPGVGSGAQS